MDVGRMGSREVRVLPAGSYTIHLVMDNREIHSQVDRDRLEREIGEGGVDYSLRALDIGDVLWIAKSGTNEFVLDYIVERKRMDDLVGSIKDGRFHEQKVSPLLCPLTIVSSHEIRNETYHLSHRGLRRIRCYSLPRSNTNIHIILPSRQPILRQTLQTH